MKNRKPNRHPFWNYSSDGAYFVTICTKNREHFFGEISGPADCGGTSKMVLNDVREIAQNFWAEIPHHFSGVKLLDFVVMPNHIHGIIWILGNGRGVGTGHGLSLQSPHHSVGDGHGRPLPNRPMQKIPVIISQYKSSVTRFLRQNCNNHDFAWQRSYHDHIIRTEKSLENIRNYVQQNPRLWHRDRNNNFGVWM